LVQYANSGAPGPAGPSGSSGKDGIGLFDEKLLLILFQINLITWKFIKLFNSETGNPGTKGPPGPNGKPGPPGVDAQYCACPKRFEAAARKV